MLPGMDHDRLDDALHRARATLREKFGLPDFRPAQRRAIVAVLQGRDALIVLPTGGGKSLCYQVPALSRRGLTVVVSPLISLMKDQVDALARRGLPAAFINSTLSANEVSSRLGQVRDGMVQLLYLAPERLDHGRTLSQLSNIGVSLLAVDEAHCISEWGHNFRPSYRRIGSIRERLGSPQTVALTATATPVVRADITRQLALRNPATIVAGFDRTNLSYFVVRTRTVHDKTRATLEWLRSAAGSAIVYAPTRKTVEHVAGVLSRAGVRAVAYHAGLDDASRQHAQNAFMEQRVRVIVATSAFGMGIDKADVRLVVHHAMPGSLEAYYQEAGRAGRDGNHSVCVLLHALTDRQTHEFFVEQSYPDRSLVQRLWRLLCASADRDGLMQDSLDAVFAQLRPGAEVSRLAAALRLLVASNVAAAVPANHRQVKVRLLATPARISSELVGPRASDREVLRALWKVAGTQLLLGARVDLDALPRKLGGSRGIVPILERLETEQIVQLVRNGASVRVDPRYLPATSPPIDWSGLERRRVAELARLQAMQNYAQTRACRRAFVLRYFGDTGVRERCNACDRCLGTTSMSSPQSGPPHTPLRSRPRTIRLRNPSE